MVANSDRSTWIGGRMRVCAAPAAASLFVLAFELLRGTRDSMWVDEGFSYLVSQRSFGSLLQLLWSEEANMGPYYLVLWFWVRVDDGDLWIRALSAVATVAAIWAIWSVVRRWSGHRVAGVAVAVFALTPFVLSWSMQARGYAMAMAFTAWSLVFADRVVRGAGRLGGAVSAAAFGATVGLSVATQLSTGVVFLGMTIAMFAANPGRRMAANLLVSGAVAVIVFAPFLHAFTQRPEQISWASDVTPESFFRQLFVATSGPFWAAMIASGWVCLVVASTRHAQFRSYLLALAGSVSGILGLVVVSVLVQPMFVGRYLVGCIPLAVVAAVGGWSSLRPRGWSRVPVALAAVAVVVVAGVNLGYSRDRTRPPSENFRGVVAKLESSMEPEDALVAIPGFLMNGVSRYVSPGSASHRLDRSTGDPDNWFVEGPDGSRVRVARIWVLSNNRQALSAQPLPQWLLREFPTVVLRKSFGQLWLELRRPESPDQSASQGVVPPTGFEPVLPP